jgi:hypothetical protein
MAISIGFWLDLDWGLTCLSSDANGLLKALGAVGGRAAFVTVVMVQPGSFQQVSSPDELNIHSC